jgi:hypothetical protein
MVGRTKIRARRREIGEKSQAEKVNKIRAGRKVPILRELGEVREAIRVAGREVHSRARKEGAVKRRMGERKEKKPRAMVRERKKVGKLRVVKKRGKKRMERREGVRAVKNKVDKVETLEMKTKVVKVMGAMEVMGGEA